jgi:GH24 family phage-related lysozyme (muramidase)
MKLLLENWREYVKEQEGQEYQIYCDMDGVLVDFVAGTVEHITKQLQAGEAEELKEIILLTKTSM